MAMCPAGVAYSSGTKGRKDLFAMTTLMNMMPLLFVNLWDTGNITYAYREAIYIYIYKNKFLLIKKTGESFFFVGTNVKMLGRNIVGYWFVTLQCKTIYYFIKRSCGCKFMGIPRNRRTSTSPRTKYGPIISI